MRNLGLRARAQCGTSRIYRIHFRENMLLSEILQVDGPNIDAFYVTDDNGSSVHVSFVEHSSSADIRAADYAALGDAGVAAVFLELNKKVEASIADSITNPADILVWKGTVHLVPNTIVADNGDVTVSVKAHCVTISPEELARGLTVIPA
jgi:hypothetical protein